MPLPCGVSRDPGAETRGSASACSRSLSLARGGWRLPALDNLFQGGQVSGHRCCVALEVRVAHPGCPAQREHHFAAISIGDHPERDVDLLPRGCCDVMIEDAELILRSEGDDYLPLRRIKHPLPIDLFGGTAEPDRPVGQVGWI